MKVGNGKSKRAKREIIVTLAERFPACFVSAKRRRRPLKIGIANDLLAALPDVAASDIGFALMIYTSNPDYLNATREGAPRVDLGGEITGYVTAEEAAHAKKRWGQLSAQKRAKTAAGLKKPKSQRGGAVVTLSAPRLGLADLKAAAMARRRVV
jgi:ProP effector